jgi:hypothetical protein
VEYYSDEEADNHNNDDENEVLNTDEVRNELEKEMKLRYEEEIRKRKDGLI